MRALQQIWVCPSLQIKGCLLSTAAFLHIPPVLACMSGVLAAAASEYKGSRQAWLILPLLLSWMLGPMGMGGFSGGGALPSGMTTAPIVSSSTHM